MGNIILWAVIIFTIFRTLHWGNMSYGTRKVLGVGYYLGGVPIVFSWIAIAYFISNDSISRFHLLWVIIAAQILSHLIAFIVGRLMWWFGYDFGEDDSDSN